MIGINCFDKFIDIGLEGSYGVTCKVLEFRGVLEDKIKLIFVIGLIDDDVHTGFVSTADDNITMFGELFCGEGKSFSEGLAVGKITLFCGFST